MIAENPNQIQRLDDRFYKVASQSGNGMYDVARTKAFAIGWICDCPDFTHRQVKCKHIWAVEFSLKLREAVQARVIEPVSVEVCLYCRSPEIVRDGLRHNRYGDIQKWNCKACNRYFTVNIGFEKMRATPQAITSAMQLYFSGESLRNTQRFLRLQGVQVSHVAVLKWIRKYVALMNGYLEQITPHVSDTWRADELYLKVKGDTKYLYALMDDQTRFWIAQQVADTKYTADITPLFREGRHATGKVPSAVITDGAFNFNAAIRHAFPSHSKALAIQHIRHVRMSGDLNNNKMERFNGEVRDREKVMRSLKRSDTPILTGYQIYHNYIRPHMALENKTPAEKAGIKVNGENKWLTLIQNAKRDSK
jgi:putative transposase